MSKKMMLRNTMSPTSIVSIGVHPLLSHKRRTISAALEQRLLCMTDARFRLKSFSKAWLLVRVLFEILLCARGGACMLAAEEKPEDLEGIGGRWFVRKTADQPVYFLLDGERYVDLFSYHMRDSNRDAIDEVRISHDQHSLIIRSQGYPNHPTADFPNSGNPNTIRIHDFTFYLPLLPRKAEHITRLPMGPIGTAINGVVFFNPFEQGGMNALEGYSEVWLDSCCGHPEMRGVYHYHKYPTCVKSPFPDDSNQHSPVIGFAFDGFPVHGPYEAKGRRAMDIESDLALDACNGHEDRERGYHYHATPGKFPYIIGGYAGVPDMRNNRGMTRMGYGPIRDNAEGASQLIAVISRIEPVTLKRNSRQLVTIHLDPEKAKRGVLPAGKPSWVQIGPCEASEIERSGNIVKATIDVPSDASIDVPLDFHIEFTGQSIARPEVFKKNNACRVVE